MASKDISELEYLSLISKICTELDNHLGFSDKTLAEFIVSVADGVDNVGAFGRQLKENGADDFSDAFITSLYRLICRLKPKSTPAAGPAKKIMLNDEDIVDDSRDRTRELEERKKKYPALAKPNEPVEKVIAEKFKPMTILDELESLLQTSKEKVVPVEEDSEGDGRGREREKEGRRSRSHSPRRRDDRRRSRSHSRERRGRRSRSRDRHRSRSRSPRRDRDHRHTTMHSDRDRDGHFKRKDMDSDPIIGKIYNGQ
eukprot:Ihof_evm3s704 gene=Ihof_evmTU3s704